MNPNPSPATRFKPGHNRPGPGRPRKGEAIGDALRELVEAEEITVCVTSRDGNREKSRKTHSIRVEDGSNIKIALATIILQKALGGDVAAIREVNDRVDGKARQFVEVDAGPKNPLEELTDEELRQEIERLSRTAESGQDSLGPDATGTEASGGA